MNASTLDWYCKHTWKKSAKNTFWCLLGCAIGDFGTILFFQLTEIPFPLLGIMVLAIINGLITSIILETIILIKQGFSFYGALKTASGMSLISMLSMEIMMNYTDYLLLFSSSSLDFIVFLSFSNSLICSAEKNSPVSISQ